MTGTLEALGRQKATMTSIRGLVHTMKTLAAINAHPYEQAAHDVEAYQEIVLTGLHALLRIAGPLPVPPPGGGDRLLVAFGSDHGLCGGYNETLAEAVAARVADGLGTRVLCVGARMAAALEGRGIAPRDVLAPPASPEGIGRLARALLSRMAPGDAVSLAYTSRAAHGRAEVAVQPLLPLDPALLDDLARRPWTSRSLPGATMSPAALAASLTRGYVFTLLWRAAADAMTTENAARLALMQQAEQSVDERLGALSAEMNGVRQTGITTELLDVAIGFETLRRDRRRREVLTLINGPGRLPASHDDTARREQGDDPY